MKKASDSTYAAWHDPSTYDPLTMGPPYLPASKPPRPIQAKVAQEILLIDVTPKPVGCLVAGLRALSLLHQTHHWQITGADFYADHQLLDRLYNDTTALIDPFAEKLVGLLGAAEVDLVLQFASMGDFLAALVQTAKPQPTADDRLAQSLLGVQKYLKLMQEVYTQLKETGKMTLGLDNLLQEVADTMEGFAYLLQQRLSTQYGYAR